MGASDNWEQATIGSKRKLGGSEKRELANNVSKQKFGAIDL